MVLSVSWKCKELTYFYWFIVSLSNDARLTLWNSKCPFDGQTSALLEIHIKFCYKNRVVPKPFSPKISWFETPSHPHPKKFPFKKLAFDKKILDCCLLFIVFTWRWVVSHCFGMHQFKPFFWWIHFKEQLNRLMSAICCRMWHLKNSLSCWLTVNKPWLMFSTF